MNQKNGSSGCIFNKNFLFHSLFHYSNIGKEQGCLNREFGSFCLKSTLLINNTYFFLSYLFTHPYHESTIIYILFSFSRDKWRFHSQTTNFFPFSTKQIEKGITRIPATTCWTQCQKYAKATKATDCSITAFCTLEHPSWGFRTRPRRSCDLQSQ